MTKSTGQNNQEKNSDLASAVKFDQGEFEKRLAEVSQDLDKELKQSVVYKEPGQLEVPLNFNIPGVAAAPKKENIKAEAAEEEPQSGLLASLAQEARQSLKNRDAVDQEKLGRDQEVHAALARALKFFVPFIKHVNAVEPAINRIYRLDARSVFANLKWKDALVDSRKQSMSESALLSHVAFSVNLQAPEPVLLKRPWEQFEALVKELNHLKIRALDDLHAIYKRPQQEWLETRLDPALPVQIMFHGSYETGRIEILTRNLADFGQTAFSLEPVQISQALLDELGLYLIGRTDKLPVLLNATAK